jgi:hypothetical protein
LLRNPSLFVEWARSIAGIGCPIRRIGTKPDPVAKRSDGFRCAHPILRAADALPIHRCSALYKATNFGRPGLVNALMPQDSALAQANNAGFRSRFARLLPENSKLAILFP